MSAEQLEAYLVWLDAQAEAAAHIADRDHSSSERADARGRALAYATAARKLRAALESSL